METEGVQGLEIRGVFGLKPELIGRPAGGFLHSVDDVARLLVGVHQGQPVFLGDIAEVSEGPETPDSVESRWYWDTPIVASRHEPGRLYLASPLTVAASAIEGRIVAYSEGMFARG